MSINIGISMRVVNSQDYYEPRDAISHDWNNFFLENSLNFALIPNCGNDVYKFLDNKNFDLLILSNGNDLIHDNMEPKINDSSKIRDLTEKNIIDYALNNNIKILGICRGAQMLNLYFGGTLIYDNSSLHLAKVSSKKIIDKLTIEYFKRGKVKTNCFHNYVIKPESLAENFTPILISDDGYVEGFYINKKMILGVQWHPERDFTGNSFCKKIVLEFIHNGAWWI